jgi:hypothetical protein
VIRPVSGLVTHLWQKLANRDPSLKPIADSFQSTATSGSYEGRGEPQPLKPLLLTASGVYASLVEGDAIMRDID